MKNVMKFIREEDGLTTVEYAVAGALVAAAVAAAFTDLGAAVTAQITNLTGIVEVNGAAAGGAGGDGG